jgi:hypothetical protein
MALDFSRCRLAPFAHQREDVAWLVERPFALVASEMRTGKSKIVIDAAQFLFEAGVIDKVIVVAPAPVRDVWYDPDLGEIAKHAWLDLPMIIQEFHARVRVWTWPQPPPIAPRRLSWVVTNFEFLRSKARLTQLLVVCGPRTLLVGDESSFLKNYAAQQTKAFLQLRRACGRVWLLNGTPIFHSPMDLFSQGNILSPTILDCKFVTHFRARYAVQQPVLGWGGKPLDNGYGRAVQKIVGWTNLDDLQRRFQPYTVRRLQKDCLDMVPEKLAPVTLTATLNTSWPHYKSMRDEMVVWLKSGDVAISHTAAVKALRLSQITGGFLGGVEGAGVDVELTFDEQALADLGVIFEPGTKPYSKGEVDRQIARLSTPSGVMAIGREKLDVLLWFVGRQLEADPNAKVVAWFRFRAEALRAEAEVQKAFPKVTTGLVLGGQKKRDRLTSLALLKPETAPAGPVFVAGIEGTGSFGLDMCAAHTCVTMSGGYSPGKSAQTLDRVYGPGQTQPIAYYDVVAVGPKGQKTIDTAILLARRAGQDVATWTAAAWVKALEEE